MRLWGGEAVLRGHHASELFQVYDLASGEFKHAVSIDHERLTVTAQGGPWVAGQPVDFRIEFDGGGRAIKPRWRVWARPFGVLDYRELKLAEGKLLVPEDLAGIYQIKVTPESTPWQHGAAASEYKVQTLVEIRAAGAVGSITAATPLGRVDFGRGEEIPLAVYVRGNAPKDTELTLTLRDGARTLAAAKTTIAATCFLEHPKEIRFSLPKSLTERLRPGKYVLDVAGKGLTCVSQPLVIGPGMRPVALLDDDLWRLPSHLPAGQCLGCPRDCHGILPADRAIGLQHVVDRLGHPLEMVDFSLAAAPRRGRRFHEVAAGRSARRLAREARHRASLAASHERIQRQRESARWPFSWAWTPGCRWADPASTPASPSRTSRT